MCPPFPWFAKLPPEIRQQVWDAALIRESSTRLVLVWKKDFSIHPTRHLVSPFLSVNCESRARALDFYDVQLTIWKRRSPIDFEKAVNESLEEREPTVANGGLQPYGFARLNIAHDVFVLGFEDVPRDGYLYWRIFIRDMRRKGRVGEKGPWDIPLNCETTPLTEEQCSRVQTSLTVHSYSRGESPAEPYQLAHEAFHKSRSSLHRSGAFTLKRAASSTFLDLMPMYGRMEFSPLFLGVKTSLHMMIGGVFSGAEGFLYDASLLDGETLLKSRTSITRQWVPSTEETKEEILISRQARRS
jgi:hypothetical protein